MPADYMSLLERIIIELSQLLGQIALVEEFYTDEDLYLFVYDFKNVIFAEDELLAKVNSYIAKKAAEGIRLLYGISDMYKSVSNNILKAVTECDEIILTNGHSHSGNKSALDSLYTEHSDVHLPNAAAMQSFILDKALELSGLVKNQEINAPSKIMLSAIRYIDAHYTENISHLLLRHCLQLVELSFFCHEFFIGSCFDGSAATNDNDSVSVFNCRKTVGYD